MFFVNENKCFSSQQGSQNSVVAEITTTEGMKLTSMKEDSLKLGEHCQTLRSEIVEDR